MNKDAKGVWTIPQHIIDTAAHDHKRFLFRKIADNLCLIIKDIFIGNKFPAVRLDQFALIKTGLIEQRRLYLRPVLYFSKRLRSIPLSSEAMRMICLS